MLVLMAKSAIFPNPPKLELQKKHTIEVVVDRFKVRDNLTNVLPSRLKLRWSFPVVLR